MIILLAIILFPIALLLDLGAIGQKVCVKTDITVDISIVMSV